MLYDTTAYSTVRKTQFGKIVLLPYFALSLSYSMYEETQQKLIFIHKINNFSTPPKTAITMKTLPLLLCA